MTVLYYLRHPDRGAFHVAFADGTRCIFAPSCDVPEQYVADLLSKVLSFTKCCGKNAGRSYTFHVFATEEQLASGERVWVNTD